METISEIEEECFDCGALLCSVCNGCPSAFYCYVDCDCEDNDGMDNSD